MLRLIIREPLLANVMGLFHTFDDPEEVVNVDPLRVKDDDDSPDDGVHLCPVHAVHVAQCLLEVLGHVRLARPADGTNLNMSPSIADPEAAVAPSRIHPIKGGPNRVTDGFAESGPNSSRHPADGANQPEGIHPPARMGRQLGCGCCLVPVNLSHSELLQPAESCHQVEPHHCVGLDCARTEPVDLSHDGQLSRNDHQLEE
jgi:hypothetical protein